MAEKLKTYRFDPVLLSRLPDVCVAEKLKTYRFDPVFYLLFPLAKSFLIWVVEMPSVRGR